MKQAMTLMIQGTASTVGKSTLVTGLCRLFAQDGRRVAPFKAQNMALNSYVTPDGGEIGRAQAVQAEAAGIAASVEMNPILLKPESNSRSQVIVMGHPLGAMEARDYYHDRSKWLAIVEDALNKLRAEYDLVIIEGAGSPVELNLARYDLVNMRVAQLANAPVLLVGDIDRGGIFASLLGTLMLLKEDERLRVKGLIVNKFRGDISLWRAGEAMLAQRSGIPVLGTLPFFNDIRIAEEDSVALDEGTAYIAQQPADDRNGQLDIVIVRLPYLSNYDEFDALAAEPQVRLHMASTPDEFPARPDLIILPGTKNTLSDLAWLWRRGLAQHIRQLVQEGCAILGICGGYQMLGERVRDPLGSEAEVDSVEPGLHLLPIETVFSALHEKTTRLCHTHINASSRRGLFAALHDEDLQAYQIHLGRTALVVQETLSNQFDHAGDCTPVFDIDDQSSDGWLSPDGWRAGCYLHGLFENDMFRHSIISALAQRRSPHAPTPTSLSFNRHTEYDKLAQLLRTHLDMATLKRLGGL